MKTEQEIRVEIDELKSKIEVERCPCGCQEPGHDLSMMEINTLERVLGEEVSRCP